MTIETRGGRWRPLVAAATAGLAVLALHAAPAVAAAPPKGKLVVTVHAPAGVPANVTVSAGGRRVLAKPPRSTIKRFTLRVATGTAKIGAKPVAFGGALYAPAATTPRTARVRRSGTARVQVRFVRLPTARRLAATTVARDAITLAWQAPRGAVVRLRRAKGERAPATVRGGQAVAIKGRTATDTRLQPATTYSYSLFTKRGRRWLGPVTLTAGTRAADPTVAAYVAPPSTAIVEPGESDAVTVTPTGVSVRLAAGRPTPLVGAGFVLPVSATLPGGFLGKVASVSADGRTVQLVPAGLADAFDLYDLDVDLGTLPAIPLEADATTAPRAHAAKLGKGLKRCAGGQIEGDVALRPVITPGGHFTASIAKKWGFIPVGATFDLSAKLTLGVSADVAVRAAVSCGVDFKKIVRPITTAPVPISIVFDPAAEVSVSGALTLKDVGYTATGGFWAKGELGANTWADGGLIRETSGPTQGTLAWNASVGLELGGELTVGPGGGTDVAGAVAGVGGELIPLKATFGQSFPEGDSRRAACIKTEVGWESALNLNAKAWIGSLKISKSLTLDALKWSGTYGGPWYLPAGCNALPAAKTDPPPLPANTLLGSGVSEVSSAQSAGKPEQWGLVSGLVAGGAKAWALTTGTVAGVNLEHPDRVATTEHGTPGIPALTALAGKPTFDGAAYRVVVRPAGSTLRVRYLMATEEFPNYTANDNDVLGVFVDGVNCAKVPGTDERVSLGTINPGRNAQYFVDNRAVAPGYATSMNAVTLPLDCSVPVTPGKDVTVEVAIGDGADRKIDTAVAVLERGIWSE